MDSTKTKGTSIIRLTIIIKIKEEAQAHMETEEADLVVEVVEAIIQGLFIRSVVGLNTRQ